MFANDGDVRNALAEALGEPVRPDIWQALVDGRYVSGAIEEPNDFADVLNQYKKWDETFSRASNPQPKVRKLPADDQLVLWSSLLAKRAAQMPEVERFREQRLDGRLLAPSDLKQWIDDQAHEDGPSTIYLRFAVPSDRLKEGKLGVPWADPEMLVQERNAPVGSSQELLACQVPDQQGSVHKPVARYGVLGELKKISRKLAETFGWSEGQATGFILTDLPPVLSRGTVSLGYRWSRNQTTTVKMEFHPTVSPNTVKAMYSRARTDLGLGHYKPLSEKHLQLAQFYGGEKTGKWLELMNDWNKLHPDMLYKQESNFGRDCLSAWRRVTGDEKDAPVIFIDGHRLPLDSSEWTFRRPDDAELG